MEEFRGIIIGLIIGGITTISLCLASMNIYKIRCRKLREEIFIYKSILEGRKSVFYYYSIGDQKFYYMSEGLKELLGYSTEIIYSNSGYLLEVVHPDDLWRTQNNIVGDIDFSTPVIIRYKNSKGEYIWTEDNITPIYKNRKLIAFTGEVRDISWRKNLEELLTYKNNYDSLTGVYNRQHYQLWYERLHKKVNSRIALVVVDISGTKSVNNSVGLHEGNNIIKYTAEFLKKYSGDEGLIFRTGSDEFVLVYLDIDSSRIETIVSTIKKDIEAFKVANKIFTQININIGYSYSHSSMGMMDKLMEVASNEVKKLKVKNSL